MPPEIRIHVPDQSAVKTLEGLAEYMPGWQILSKKEDTMERMQSFAAKLREYAESQDPGTNIKDFCSSDSVYDLIASGTPYEKNISGRGLRYLYRTFGAKSLEDVRRLSLERILTGRRTAEFIKAVFPRIE